MSKLVVSLATRDRPQQVVETVSRSLALLASPNTVYMIQVDGDDFPTQHAVTNAPWSADSRIRINIKAREDTIAAKWNRCLTEPADVYLCAGDDDPHITSGFDAKILEAASLFEDGIGFVYGINANLSFSCFVAATAKMCELMDNTIQPEYFPYWFCDHWTDDLAKLINRIAYTDVRTDQSKAGKTQEMREPGWWATWFDAAYLMRRNQAHKIIDHLTGSDQQKELTRRLHRAVELRSRWINDQVRAQAPQLSAWSGLKGPDPRYQRVKDKAVAMIPQLLDGYGMDRVEALAFRNALIPPTTVPNLKPAVRAA